MINLFRRLNPFNLFILLPFLIVLRIAFLLRLPAHLEFNFAELFGRLLLSLPRESVFSPVQDITVTLFIVFLQGIILNRIINIHNLLGKPSFMPALMYGTVTSIFFPFLVLTPALICNFLIIWMIERFLTIYGRTEALSVMFDMGIIVGVGTLIYFPFIGFFLLLWISLIIFRPFNWREWIAGLIGFVTVYFFLGVYYYWKNAFGDFFNIFLPLTSKFPASIKINLNDYTVLIPLIAILIFSGFTIRQNFFRSYVHVRRSFQLLFFCFVLAMISFYLKPQVRVYHFLMATAPVSLFMSYYFLHAKKRWIYESLYFSLIVFIIYFQIV